MSTYLARLVRVRFPSGLGPVWRTVRYDRTRRQYTLRSLHTRAECILSAVDADSADLEWLTTTDTRKD